MIELDALLDTVPQYRLSAWINDARRVGGDGDALESNARMQVTVWGGPELNDYAAKEWSGLVGDFYRQRWDRFFDALATKDYNDAAFRKSSADWELQWCSKTSLPRIQRVDPVEQSAKLLDEG
jgi:alpha-N-acetylglucosaminidase